MFTLSRFGSGRKYAEDICTLALLRNSLLHRPAALPAERGAAPAGTAARFDMDGDAHTREFLKDIGFEVIGESVGLLHGRVLCHHEMEVDEPVCA